MMTITKDLHGIIFNIFNYKENDLIADVFTKEYGAIQLYVKGAQKTTSKSFFIFKQFNIITFDVSKLNLKELSMYKSGEVKEVFDYTKLNYEQMNTTMLISELLVKIKHLNDYDYQNYYQELLIIISDLKTNRKPVQFILNYFLYISLKVLGSGLVLDSCYQCSKQHNIIAYDIINNGFICLACFEGNSKYLKDQTILNYLYKLPKYEEIDDNALIYDKAIFELLIDCLKENTGVYLIASNYIY